MHYQRFGTYAYRIRLHNGKIAILKYAQIKASAIGDTEADKRMAGRTFIREKLIEQLGEHFERAFRECDFDLATGIPTLVMVTA